MVWKQGFSPNQEFADCFVPGNLLSSYPLTLALLMPVVMHGFVCLFVLHGHERPEVKSRLRRLSRKSSTTLNTEITMVGFLRRVLYIPQIQFQVSGAYFHKKVIKITRKWFQTMPRVPINQVYPVLYRIQLCGYHYKVGLMENMETSVLRTLLVFQSNDIK